MPKTKRDKTKEIAEELDVFDTLLSSLVEILAEKGIITQDEYENRVKQKSEKAMELTSYRGIHFGKK